VSALRILAAQAVVAIAAWLGFLVWYHAIWGVASPNFQNIAVDLASTLVLVSSLVAMWASGRRAYTDLQKRNRTWIYMIITLFGLFVFGGGLLAAAQARADPCLDPRYASGCSQTAGSQALLQANLLTIIGLVGLAMGIISFAALASIQLTSHTKSPHA